MPGRFTEFGQANLPSARLVIAPTNGAVIGNRFRPADTGPATIAEVNPTCWRNAQNWADCVGMRRT